MEEESAAPTMFDVERAGIQADHSHMCKFDSETAPGFDIVVEAIARYSAAAPEVMLTRWSSEKAERKAQRLRQAEELVGSTGISHRRESPASRSVLTVPGSVIQTPPSNTPSIIEKTPGKTQMALPAANTGRATSQIEWEVKELEDDDEMRDVEMASRSQAH